MNQRLAFQGVLDNYHDVRISESGLQEVQEPLNPSIRQPAIEDWERRKNILEMHLLTLFNELSNIPLRLVYYLHRPISNDNSSHQTQLSMLTDEMEPMLLIKSSERYLLWKMEKLVLMFFLNKIQKLLLYTNQRTTADQRF